MNSEPALRDILGSLAQYLEYQLEEGVVRVEMARRPALAPGRPTRPAVATRPQPVPHASPGVPAAARPPDSVRPAVARVTAPPAPSPVAPARPAAAGAGSLAEIAGQAAACTRCALHKTRTQTVPGQGCATPEILFVGEGPGEDEDRTGLAFVGAAGRLLTKMIEAMGLAREDVFIANVVKCRPPNNRTPMPDEMEACMPYLRAQIALLKPKVIVALGGTALQGLLGLTGIMRRRGTWLNFEGIDLMPTFHPSFLLRTENKARRWDVWQDMVAVLERIGRTPPAKHPSPPA